jgi:hypothetical protein
VNYATLLYDVINSPLRRGTNKVLNLSMTYLDDILMVELWSFSLKPITTSHLEAEECTHRFFGSIWILLSLFLLDRCCRGDSNNRCNNWMSNFLCGWGMVRGFNYSDLFVSLFSMK